MNDILEELTFEGQKDSENLIVFTRQHWYLLVGSISTSIVASFLPIVLIILSAKFIVSHPGSSVLFMFGWLIYIMIIWFVLAYKITMHTLNTWIVTDDRILDIVQLGLFDRKVSELHLEAIQDISVNTHGMIESYFNFGNIEIQTGATAQRFMFEQVPNPIEIKDKIMTAANAYVQNIKKEQI